MANNTGRSPKPQSKSPARSAAKRASSGGAHQAKKQPRPSSGGSRRSASAPSGDRGRLAGAVVCLCLGLITFLGYFNVQAVVVANLCSWVRGLIGFGFYLTPGALLYGSGILFDAAYEAFITQDDVPHSIFEIDGAKTCAIEFRSFSKTAGFTGVRCAYTVVPKELMCGPVSLNALWSRRQATKFNGVSYVTQRAAEAVYSDEGRKQVRDNIAYYLNNAKTIINGLESIGIRCFGGKNSPYIWFEVPDGLTSWQMFDKLLEEVQVVGTPGSGFGAAGEGYFRLTAFAGAQRTEEAVERIRKGLRR